MEFFKRETFRQKICRFSQSDSVSILGNGEQSYEGNSVGGVTLDDVKQAYGFTSISDDERMLVRRCLARRQRRGEFGASLRASHNAVDCQGVIDEPVEEGIHLVKVIRLNSAEIHYHCTTKKSSIESAAVFRSGRNSRSISDSGIRADCVETLIAATIAPVRSRIGTAMERRPISSS